MLSITFIGQQRGVLLSASGDDGYLEVGVSKGLPYVVFKLPNSPEIVLHSTVRVDNTSLHTIRVYRINADIRFTVDKELAIETKVKTDKFDLEFTHGIKVGQAMSNKQNTIIGYRGCIYKGKSRLFVNSFINNKLL